ncbi:MAG: peptidoglycan-binding protein [Pseudomonadota bacterium]
MKQTGPWSVKGIDQRARDIAREAAREEGLTLGEYINRLIIDGHHEGAKEVIRSRLTAAQAERPVSQSAAPVSGASTDVPRILDQLTRRIESSEARSTLAITGIDQSVLGLITRLENAEHSQQMMGADFARTLEDIRSTHLALKDKVSQLESDDAASRNLEALKALEVALGRLASHVYEENESIRSQTSGFEDRISDMEGQVERSLSEATETVKSVVKEAELRSEGANRHLADRLASLELSVADKLSKVSGEPGIEQGEIVRLDGAISHIQARLTEAETTTNVALKTLEANFRSLDKRLEALAQRSDDAALIEAIQADFDLKFEKLTNDLRTNLGEVRTDFASQIDLLTEMADTSHVEASLSELHSRLGDVEKSSSEAARDAVGKLSAHLEQRVTDMVNQKVPDLEIGRLSDDLQQRIIEGEKRNAAAIEQVGEQVATVAQRLQLRQDEALRTMSHQLEENRRQTDTRLSDALGNVSDKLNQVQRQSSDQLSPMQKAITSLARRIEAMEDFSTPPFSTAPANSTVVPPATTPATDTTPEATEAQPEEEEVVAVIPDDEIDDLIDEVVADVAAVGGAESDDFVDEEAVAEFETHLEDEAVETDPVDTRSDLALEATLEEEIQALDLPEPEMESEAEDIAPVEFELEKELLGSEKVLEAAADIAVEELLSDKALEAIIAEAAAETEPVDTPAFMNAGWAKSDSEDLALDDLPPFDDFSLEDVPPFDEIEGEVGEMVEEMTASQEADTTAITSEQQAEFDDLSKEWAASSAVDVAFGSESKDPTPPRMDSLEQLIEWPEDEDDDGRFEPRDSDVFDKESAFEAVANKKPFDKTDIPPKRTVEDDPLAFLEPEPVDPTEDLYKDELEKVAEKTPPSEETTQDYIARARVAALEAANGNKGPLAQSDEKRSKFIRGAGLSAALLVTAAAISFWGFRQFGPSEKPIADQSSNATVPAATTAETAPEAVVTASASETETTTPTETASPDVAATDAGTVETATPTETFETTPVETAVVTPAPVEPEYTVPEEPISRIPSIESAARSGDRIAAYQLGLGKIEAGEISDGVALVQRSASAGLPAAQYELARLYRAGLGLPKDPEQAIVWLERAAAGGNAKAMQEAGIYYSDPENSGYSNAKAATWFRRAAEFGLVDSQFNLGIMYEQGIGVTADSTEAFFWAMIAAKTGDGDAQDFSEELRATLSPQAINIVETRLDKWRAAAPNGTANGVFTNVSYGKVTSTQVMGVQETLRGLGYDIGGIDGQAGQRTITAIREFQSDNGLNVTGSIDNLLIDQLNRAAAPLR